MKQISSAAYLPHTLIARNGNILNVSDKNKIVCSAFEQIM